jgi:hypothetical protein
MDQRLPSFRTVVRLAWSDTLMVFRRMPDFFFITLLITFAVGLAQYLVVWDGSSGKIIKELLDVPGSLLIVPFEIAVHRLVLLGEIPSHYLEQIGTERFRRFLLWSLVLWVMTAVPSIFAIIFPVSSWVSLSFGVIVILIAFVVTVRLVPFFPAISIDARGASVTNALADSRGYFWFIVRSALIPIIPFLLIVLSVIVLAAFGQVDDIDSVGIGWRLLHEGVIAAGATVAITVATVAFARVFEAIGQNLK